MCLLNQRKRPGPTDSSEVIKALRKQRQQVEQEKNSLEHEARILADYSKTLKAEHVSPADVAEFLKSYGGHVKSGIDAVARLEERIQELDKKIFKEEDAASSKQGPMSNGELTVVIAAEFEEEVELKLTYSELSCSLYTRTFPRTHLSHPQSLPTHSGNPRTSYTLPRRIASPRQRSYSTTEPSSRKAPARTGRMQS